MRASLFRWLLVGVVVAVVAAGATMGGLVLLFPRQAPVAIAATVKGQTPILATPVPPELKPGVSALSPAKTRVSPRTVAEAEPQARATARGRDYVILQIGDSHTAADLLFTGEVRDRLQAKFGAGGLFLPPGIPREGVQSADFEIRADDAWTYTAMSATDRPDRFWLSGYTASAGQSGAMVSFMARDRQAFDSIDVSFLKASGGGQADILLDDSIVDHVSLDGAAGQPLIRRLMPQIGRVGSFKTLKVVTTSGGPVELSGVFVDQRQSGVSYLSVGFPDAPVGVLKQMSPGNLADDMARIAPDMVVLAFGTSEGFDDTLDVAAFKKTLAGIIDLLTRGNAERRLVIVGPPPAARQQGSCRDVPNACGTPPVAGACWAQPPKLAAVRDAEREVAQAVGATFWDWSSVLPTACALERGQLGEPPIFGPDRVHMTERGYRDSADAFAQVLIPLVGRAMGN